MQNRRIAIRATMAACAGALTLAAVTACGSDDASSQGTASAAAEKAPIKLGLIVDATSPTSLSWPQTMEAGKVVAEAINDEGGIDGHPIEVVECDSKLDPNAATNCARKVAKEGVAATLMWGINTDRVLQVMEPAGIPSLSLFPSFPSDFNSEVSFPLFSSIPLNPGLGVLAARNCEHPRLVQVESPYADPTLAYVNAGLASVGEPPIDSVDFAPTTTDFAPVAAQATDGADCLLMQVTEQQAAAIYPAIQQTGKDVRIIGITGSNIDDSMIERFPDLLEGAFAVGNFPPFDSEPWQPYAEITETYSDPGEFGFFGSSSAGTYVVYQVLKDAIRRALKTGDEVTPEAVKTALESTRGATAGGLLPGVDLDVEHPSPIEGMPRMFNANVVFSQVEDGGLVPVDGGEFTDMTDALAGTGDSK